jgi:hypothetical protein
MKEQFTFLEFGSLQTGWEGINEFLFLECETICKKGGGLYGPEFVSYNNYVVMKRAWVNPEFDFGKVLGYAIKKWSSLVNNYADIRYLDLLRAEINQRKNRNARSYNFSFHFSNHHGSGKDCLISIMFTKRVGVPHPILIFQVRTSEVTKRLLFDFLLVQRIGEYIYGNNDFEVHLYAPSMYITAESFVMYNNVKSIKKLLKTWQNSGHHIEKPDNHRFQDKVFKIYKDYMDHPDPDGIRYKVHRRSAMQIRRDSKGEPLSGVKSMLAKNLTLCDLPLEISKEVITRKQILTHKKHNNGSPTT